METSSNTSPTPTALGGSSLEKKGTGQRFNRRTIGRLFAGLLVFLTLVMLFYVEEKVRGKWAWHRYQRAMERQGVSFDDKHVFPPPLPPEKNLAGGPTLKPLYDYVLHQKPLDTNALQRLWNVSYFPISSNYQYILSPYSQWRDAVWPNPVKMLGEPSPLTPKRPPPPPTPTALEAARLLTNLIEKASGPTLAGLKSESRTRPTGQFDFPPAEVWADSTILPHLTELLRFVKQCQTLAVAQLYLGQKDAAHENIMIGFRLGNLISDEPFWVSHFIRTHINEYLVGAVWYGMAKKQWNAVQLEEIQRQLERTHFVTDVRKSLDAERIMSRRKIENFARRFPYQNLFSTASDLAAPIHHEPPQDPLKKKIERWLSHLYPKGWFYFEQINAQQFYLEHVINPIPTNQTRVNLVAYEQNNKSVREASSQWPKRPVTLAELLNKKLWAGAAIQRLDDLPWLMRNHATCTLAATACALERYRLDHGAYPKQLADLVPRYMKAEPFDYMSGQTLKYQQKADGTFLLYSFGRNGVDDGGKVVLLKSGAINQEEGDWVWQYPSQSSR